MRTYPKNILIMLLFIITYSTPNVSNAQVISYGIKGGLNISETSMSYYETHTKTGINAYVFADYNISRKFSISTQAGYTQKGFKTASQDYYIEQIHYYGSVNANLNYIDISVLGKVKFITGKVIPYISAGPSLGIKISDGASADGISNEYSIYDLQYLLDNVYSNSFGIKIGVGAEINIAKYTAIIIESNYNFDLTTSYEPPAIMLGISTWSSSKNVKNNVLEISAGVKF